MISRVLILGSGPIVIGQAAEFDYSGTQACLACREMGVHTILVNSNPATIQTDSHVADVVYIEPLRVETVTAIIERERPDGVIATVGGQTALNLAIALDEAGVLEQYDVRVLGTGLDAIRRGEDRALFSETVRDAGEPVLPSVAVTSVAAALRAADSIGYPVMCRSAFALGGAGSGFAAHPSELMRQVEAGLRSSGNGQVLIEKSVSGWAEIEYEVVRDGLGNCAIVCNMENIDPMGVHTGDSIVVAPSQTLTDEEYQLLRRVAMRVVSALRVEGACNVQFALNRITGAYFVIEVNPRLSRSSALASKATGYPIAKVATRIALGRSLPEIRNDITGTSAFFEPALDYVTVKIPRWPFDKFRTLETTVGTSMRSTGEAMAIGATFEEAIGKAVRSLDVSVRACADSEVEEQLTRPNALRLPAILAALDRGWSVETVVRLTKIHPWFVSRLAALVRSRDLHSYCSSSYAFRMVDSCAGEFEARTPYFYGTDMPGAENEALSLPGPKAIILGSGPIRIGQGIEFDYATVHACHALTQSGVRSIIINNNPETVSTDYSTSDRLYVEPLDTDAVMAVVDNERDGLLGVIPQFGGQTALNLVGPLAERGVPILGTPPDAIDIAEDRARASALLASLRLPAPQWTSVADWSRLLPAVAEVGFPALLRPSYVLSGAGMTVVRRREDVEEYLYQHAHIPLARPLLVDRFLEGAVEINVDAVSDGIDTVTVVMEQLESCGIHSGDSAEVYPVQTIGADVLRTVEQYTNQLARALGVIGLMNVQYAVLRETVYVLEINPRASRSVPFASKASGVPLADLAIGVIVGRRLRDMQVPEPRTGRMYVKEVVFPFGIFPALPPLLGPEMQSTGETMGHGPTFAEAYWKAQMGAGLKHLPFGRRVYLSLPAGTPQEDELTRLLIAGECEVLTSSPLGDGLPVWADDVDVRSLGMAIVLGRSDEEVALIRRASGLSVPCVTTSGGLRGLCLALAEGEPIFTPEPLENISTDITSALPLVSISHSQEALV